MYCAPEVLLGAVDYTESIDIWAVGVIFAEMCTLRYLFLSEVQIDHLFKTFRYASFTLLWCAPGPLFL
jgi:serine/threonine protein kinase